MLNNLSPRKSFLALLIATSLPAAFASDYYVVAPLPCKKVANDAITVSLNPLAAPAGQARRTPAWTCAQH